MVSLLAPTFGETTADSSKQFNERNLVGQAFLPVQVESASLDRQECLSKKNESLLISNNNKNFYILLETDRNVYPTITNYNLAIL